MADLPAVPDQTERAAVVAAHLAFVAHGLLPFIALVIPFALMTYYKDKSPFVVNHAKEALNFQIALLIASLIGAALSLAFIGFVLLPVLLIGGLLLPIGAAIEGGSGREYRYPVTIRFIR